MSKALSLDLRVPVLAAVAEGLSHRDNLRPGALGGNRRSSRIEAQRALFLNLLKETSNITMIVWQHA